MTGCRALNQIIYIMRNLFFLTILTFFLISCGNSKLKNISLTKRDSLFVDKELRLTVTSRVHRTNDKGYVNGHAQVDSSKFENIYANLNREFFFKREKTFIGTFEKVSEYNSEYIVVNLEKDIEKEILKDEEHFKKKILTDKKKFYSGQIGKGFLLENFPTEIYIKLYGLNNVSADSIFDVLK
jgi:hypothetical protein